jgi:cytochrome bd-type quinol oxidase subunit 2
MVKAYQFLKKYGVAMGFGIGAFIVVLMYIIILGGFPDGGPTNAELTQSGLFDFGLFSTYFLLIFCMIVSLIFPIMYMAKNFKESFKALVGIAAVVIVFLIAYGLGSSEIPAEVTKGIAIGKISPISGSQMKLIDGSIFMGYIMLILGIGSIVFANIRAGFGK